MFWTVAKLAPMSVAIYPFAALLSWLMKLVAWIMSPVIATVSMLTGEKEVGGLLAYLYTHDASLDGGVENSIPGYVANATGFKLWWQRVRWICRNPAYRFNAYVLGFAAEGSTRVFEAGAQYPNFRYWTVMRSPGGWHFFGYRGKNDRWFGWNYMAYAGRHQLKAKPF